MAEHHPLGDIEYLKENLLNSYKLGFPILKELVQNAEDARARHLDYGWIEGLSTADHPLLRSPALFMLDNGDFTEDNAKAIRYILGGSSKPNQQDSIGKFGLGLKSVFHLCEAFFYIAPSIPNSKYKNFGLFNPWAGAENKDDYHNNWDNFSEQDISCVKDAVKQILDRDIYQEKWFILWIPLRQQWHKTNNKEEDGIELGCIKNGQDDFFDTKVPEFLANEDTQKQLSLLLPLLSNIKEIRYWEKSLENPKFEIKLKDAIQRHSNFSELPIKKNREIKGQVSIDNKNAVNFSGFETITDSLELNNIQESSELPTKFKYIKPHCAIIFSQVENIFTDNKSTLFLRTAVFLPINQDCEYECQTEKSYYITLHGYFFVDFARTGILGWDKDKWLINSEKLKDDDDVAHLKKQWNFYLYKELLSQLLQSLEQAVIQLQLSQYEVKAICEKLKDSSLLRNNCNNIYVKYQYIYCVHLDTNQTGWQLLEVNHKILTLSSIPDWDVFSYLKQLAENKNEKIYFTLSESDSPNLCPKNKPNKWDEQDILAVLKSLNPETIFTEKEHINYLKSFLEESTKNKLSSKIQDKLTELLKKGLSMGIAKDLRKSIKLLISLIDKTKVFVIDCDCDQDQDILQSIYQLELEVLVIHKDFNYENSNQLDSANDAISILKCLTNMLKNGGNQEKQSQIYNLIKYVLKSANKHLQTVFEKCSNLPIEGQNLKTSQQEFYTLSKIQGGKFFAQSAKSENNKLAQLLQEALANQEIILIDQEIAKILKPVFTLKDSSSCLELLSNNTQLSEPQNRVNLLKELLKNDYSRA